MAAGGKAGVSRLSRAVRAIETSREIDRRRDRRLSAREESLKQAASRSNRLRDGIRGSASMQQSCPPEARSRRRTRDEEVHAQSGAPRHVAAYRRSCELWARAGREAPARKCRSPQAAYHCATRSDARTSCSSEPGCRPAPRSANESGDECRARGEQHGGRRASLLRASTDLVIDSGKPDGVGLSCSDGLSARLARRRVGGPAARRGLRIHGDCQRRAWTLRIGEGGCNVTFDDSRACMLDGLTRRLLRSHGRREQDGDGDC